MPGQEVFKRARTCSKLARIQALLTGTKRLAMADTGIPHFRNDLGVSVIEVGAHEFMCIGATPPFDHPHIFIDLGSDTEAVCSYCSTLYRFNPALKNGEAKPAEAVWHDRPAA